MSSIVEQRIGPWLADVVKDVDGSQIAALAEVVTRATESCTPAGALDLVAYAHEVPDGSQRAHAALEAAAEGVFIGALGDVRPRRLAGAAVALLLADSNNDTAVCAAIGTRSAALLDHQPQIAVLPDLAVTALRRISTSRRARRGGKTDLRGAVNAELGKNIGVPDDPSPVTHSELRTALTTLRKGLRTVADHADAESESVRHRQRLLDEETDVLWWALGARSERLDCPWSAIGLGTPLLSAVELFGKLKIDPPPVSAAALLRMAIAGAGANPDEPIAFDDAAAAAVEATEHLPAAESAEAFCPVLTGLSAARVNKEATASPLRDASAIDLAEQLTRELALQRMLGDAA